MTDPWPTPTRTPRVYEKVWLYGERLTILQVATVDYPEGPRRKVATTDDAGARIERYADQLWWDETADAWREIVTRPVR